MKYKFAGERFYIDALNFSDMESLNSLSELILKLNKQVQELGVFSSAIDVWLDKGSDIQPTKIWHVDGNASVKSISINFSSITDWSTRIVDDTNVVDIFGKVAKNIGKKITDKDEIKKIELVSKASLNGFFYDVKEILYRSPNQNDLQTQIQPSDYRLFIRFRQV